MLLRSWFQIALLQVVVLVTLGAGGYDLVGKGQCEDASGQLYERWYLAAAKAPTLVYQDSVDECQCPECQRVCDLFLACYGYQYRCCQAGVDGCDAGAAVLFGRGRLPAQAPPGNFSNEGSPAAWAAGPAPNASGLIDGASEGDTNDFCLRKLAAPGSSVVYRGLPPKGMTVVGYLFEPHTMEGTTRTWAADWQDCQLRCRSHPYCDTWGFWPDHGCHLQGASATLVPVKCASRLLCQGAGVISGPRDFSNTSAWAGSLSRGRSDVEADNKTGLPRLPPSPLLDDPAEQGAAGALVLMLILVISGFAVYLAAQADWSRRRAKRRRLKRARAKKEAQAQAQAEANKSTSSSDSDGDDDDEDSDQETDTRLLSRNRLRQP